jgi:hypothetical protein
MPVSLFKMYVPNRLYPNALAALQLAAYNSEHAFFVPSVANRVTSAVHPS